MAKPVYATVEEYGNSPYGAAAAPDDLGDRLAIASRDIDWLAMTAVYDKNEAGIPVEEDLAEALRDATIAQASYGIDPGAGLGEGQLPPGVSSASIGSASITKSKATPETVIAGITYAPRVLMILRDLMSTEAYAR
ncbi:hypothetical protein [Glycomyces paridis]|uniref:Uncharacterized protein n=1 Tax=Glycomyces paridis TaxID=2126555 RepID=A0A4S8P6V8_9ACTN|nr:hypothetical protein [Glycomyces paridis]THV26007.1 hypothetical protein E9998_19935 [Glycomyces paridis]